MQDKAQLGKRYTCFKCSCRFYDLNKPEPVCPRCGADQREDPSPDPRVAVMARYKASKNMPKPQQPDLDDSYDEDSDVDLDLDDEDDEEIEEEDE